MRDISTKAYALWVEFNIINSSTKTLVVKNVRLSWGKFYKDDNKDADIPAKDIENTKILPGGDFIINSCGRFEAASGTEGEFDVYEDGGAKVRHFYWSCPWGSRQNTWEVTERNAEWVVDSTGASLGSGPLGHITVEVFKNGP